MADPVNPFEPAKLEQYKKFFQPPARPDLLGTPAGQRALKEEEAGLSSFLGTTDYSAQNQESEDFAKLQFAMSLMGRGFASMGATPNPGEWAASTVGRNLIAPVAGDISTIAEPLMKQRQAQRAAQQQEERQIKLSALQNVQRRQEQAYTDDASATQQARQFMQNVLKKSDTVSNDYTVDGKNIPLIVRKNWKGEFEGFFDLDGEKTDRASVYRKPGAAVSPITSWATDVYVKGTEGAWVPAPGALRIADATGENSRVILNNQNLNFDAKSPGYNAKIVKPASKTSAYSSPSSKDVFLGKTVLEAFDLPPGLLGQKAVLKTYPVIPDMAGPNAKPIVELMVGGKSFRMDQHPGYDITTGNITVDRGPNSAPVTFDAADLFRFEDPKDFKKLDDVFVPADLTRLNEIKEIPGLELVTPGEAITYERNAQGGVQVRIGGIPIPLTTDQARLFQSRQLSEVQRGVAGQTVKPYTSTGKELTVGGSDLGGLRAVAGLENIRPGETIDVFSVEGDTSSGTPTKFQYRYGGNIVEIPPSVLQGGSLQTRDLSDTQEVAAGDVLETRTSFVNTGSSAVTVAGKSVGPGQTGFFTKTEQNTREFLDADFRDAGPADTAARTYMLTKPATLGNVEYAPGDEVRYNQTDFNNLSDAEKQALTEDTQLRSNTIKKEFFKSIWKTVIENNSLAASTPSKEELETLLGMFPAGMRSGGKLLREEVFNMIKLGASANPDTSVTPAAASALESTETYAQAVKSQLQAARPRYEEYVRRGILADRPWESLSFGSRRAFADMPTVLQVQNVPGLWASAEDRLARDKAAIKAMDPSDTAAFASAAELLILARHLRDGQEIDKTGRFTGFLGSQGANLFADFSPLTSGGSQRLQQIINRMKASYATLSATEGGGRDSVFRQQLQSELIPVFSKSENMNRADLDSIVNRLETNLRSVFTQETKAGNVLPKSFEIMAKEAGLTGVSVDQRRYRWIDPNEAETPPITRERVMGAVNMQPFVLDDARDLRIGRLLPPAPNATTTRYVKLKNLDGGEVLIQRSRNDGKPDPEFRPIVMFLDPESKEIKTRYQNGR